MKILAAVKGSNLYVATWSPAGNAGGDDHFVYITDKPGTAHASPWAKAGNVYFDTATKPYISAESAADTNGFKAFNNGGTGSRLAEGPSGSALEGEINLQQVFGYMPDTLYMAAVAMGDADGGGIDSQCPPAYGNNANDLETVELLPVPVASIRDENLDGVFDKGKPQMWTVVNGNTNDANYNLRRIFLDENMGDSLDITVIIQPNAPGGTNVLSNVELFSNLNRRDFVNLPGDEDPNTVTPSSVNTYYRAYPMTSIGNGQYSYTIKVTKCGAYRINARYKVNGNWVYYSDGGLRRDCAVVVTPKKALQLAMYELNPMNVEATDTTFYGRSTFKDMYTANTNKPDIINPAHFTGLGVNMIWLQPIHPIGSDNRQTDPDTNQPYDPGSPYAVKNYWKVNTVLGDPANSDQSMTEFTNFVAQMDAAGVGVMLDGTFNHSAWDCEFGDVGVQLFPYITTNPAALIRDVRPQWYSRKGNYALPATYYNNSSDNDIAGAPDRFDFGKWSDVADFFFGTYDTLVGPQDDSARDSFLSERDRFDGFATNATRELWQYFAQYPIYWLEKTGCPAGTPKNQTSTGIDGLRCDFAQGLPSAFWEYCINKTRNVKWDMVFMAESLDGNRVVNGNPRHGLSFRSARQFDVLNENMVFYWRDSFFGYPANGNGSGNAGNRTTGPTFTAFTNRIAAYDSVPLLLNLTSHDEVLPSDDPYQVLYAYSELGAMDGIPLLFYGQEAGLQNSKDNYGFTGGIANYDHNFAKYEVNFGKGIANFKRYNTMTNVWVHRDWNLQNLYGRINTARKNSTALKSQQNYFLNTLGGGIRDSNIFAVAKFTSAGVSAATQEVVFAFANNNPGNHPNVSQVFSLNATTGGGQNWFGIQPSHTYNVVDLISTNPAYPIWGAGIAGSTLITSGIYVSLPYQGQQAQYLRLVDSTAGGVLPDLDGDGIPDYNDSDQDGDGLPDVWEIKYGLNPRDATGDNGPNGDPDHDGVPNWLEYQQGTNPSDANSVLKITALSQNNGQNLVNWRSVADRNYRVQKTTSLGGSWQDIYFGTSLDTNTVVADSISTPTNLFYRVRLDP
jgi:glycosidase